MSHITKLAEGLNIGPMLWALQANPQLWDQHRTRTEDPASPHHGLSDIWARYCQEGDDPTGPHESAWYPAADLLPIRELVYPLMAFVHGDRLGGVLITRIPAGAECKPHKDPGWHARYYEKFAVQVQSAPGQAFCFDNERLETKPGDLYWFDNSATHWVENPTPFDRITVIACIRPNRKAGP